MIELRWIVDAGNGKRELQYRQQVKSHDMASGMSYEWTDWTIVEHFIEFDNDPAQDTLPLEQGRIEPPA